MHILADGLRSCKYGCVPRCVKNTLLNAGVQWVVCRVHLASIITAVNADLLVEDPGRGVTLPGLMEQMPQGYVDALVVTGTVAEVQKVSQGTGHSYHYVSLTYWHCVLYRVVG